MIRDPQSAAGSVDRESTAGLLQLIRGGDPAARDALVARFLPALRRWAHGRLPQAARDITDTDDLVQVTLLRALGKVEGFEPRHEGAFLAYLRRIVLNAVRDELRRASRRPTRSELDAELESSAPSPVEREIGREALERYEAALGSLIEDQQEAVIMRIEFGFTYQEIATALGRPSANAARMVVARGLVRLAEAMDEH
jgi:RNA polymerase sigma-70 factor (ECF subfamily)